jgi:predicted nuclease with RNAse H fold
MGAYPVIGIDLAGSENRDTGFCALYEDMDTVCLRLRSDREIIRAVEVFGGRTIAVDAPLALPKGRPSLEVVGPPHFRVCDLQLREMGIPFFPITLGPMRLLTKRGMALKERLERMGLTVFETYPGAAQDILGIPRKRAGLERMRASMKGLGFRGDVVRKPTISGDELDAAICAYVAKLYLERDYLALGDPEEVLMILPRPR